MVYFSWIILIFFLNSCVAPVYEGTTYGLDEFISDSQKIAAGKNAILEFEEDGDCLFDALNFQEDVIIEGDELYVTLHSPQRPDRMEALNLINERAGFPICNGKICLPYAPPIEAENITIQELRERIQEIYCESLKNGRVFVGFKTRRERPVQIIGTSVPTVAVDGRMRLYEVLAKAALPPYANLFKSYIIRDGNIIPVDFYKLIHEGDQSQNIVVKKGDQIFIAKPDEVTVMVTGEVRYSRVIPLFYGFISISEALAAAGGIPFTGDKSCINVIRGDLKRPKIYTLKWKDILHQPNDSLLLMSGDIICISETPLVQWNRFINQLQPSITCVNSGYGTYLLF